MGVPEIFAHEFRERVLRLPGHLRVHEALGAQPADHELRREHHVGEAERRRSPLTPLFSPSFDTSLDVTDGCSLDKNMDVSQCKSITLTNEERW